MNTIFEIHPQEINGDTYDQLTAMVITNLTRLFTGEPEPEPDDGEWEIGDEFPMLYDDEYIEVE